MADLPPEFLASAGEVLQFRHRRSLAERARLALAETQGNKAAAARLLGISRRHMHRILAASSLLMCWEVGDLAPPTNGRAAEQVFRPS